MIVSRLIRFYLIARSNAWKVRDLVVRDVIDSTWSASTRAQRGVDEPKSGKLKCELPLTPCRYSKFSAEMILCCWCHLTHEDLRPKARYTGCRPVLWTSPRSRSTRRPGQ